MLRPLPYALLLGACLLASAQPNAQPNPQVVSQDGPFFVRSVHTDPVRWSPRVARIEILTRAHVVVRGTADGSFSVALRQRVRAASRRRRQSRLGTVACSAVCSLGKHSPVGVVSPGFGSGRLDD